MGLENTSLFVFFRGVILLCAVFHAGVESSALSRSTYFTTLTNKRLKGFVVKRFKSTSQIWCGQSCLKNAWCTSTNFKLTPQTSGGKGTCELNKHDVIKENAHLQFEAEVIYSTLIKVNNCRAASTCLNGGVCFYDEKKQTYSCECKPPWTGETCADLFPCDSHPCKNNGTCTDEVNEYNCSCAPGFYGTQCEKIEGLSCSSAYRMVFGQPSIKSYASITNATSSSLSHFTMCLFVKMKDAILNGGHCLYSYATIGAPYGNAFYVCLFSPGIRISIDASRNDVFSDTKFNHLQDCRLAASTCLNGGVCFYDEKKQTYSCQCKPPWTGETCADLFPCDSHPCKNNGTCTDEVNEYNCSCAPGFYGTQCEKIEGLSCSSGL
ncbi:fibropellin-3-like [Pocillopora verrucosa]|uniref:fibropellin-3-like n=1 Tax=Pocillopora verrucosa TaxID=203993 RepID=UPI003340E83C